MIPVSTIIHYLFGAGGAFVATRLFIVGANQSSNMARAAFYISWLLLGVALAAEAIVPGTSQKLRTMPFLLSILVFGLPHGAADLMLLQTHAKATGWSALLRRFGPYLGLVLTILVCLLAFPRPVLASFLLLSAWHFGTSDVHDLRLVGFFEHSRKMVRLRGLSRGAMILSLPIAAWPQESLQIAADWIGILRPAHADVFLPQGIVASLATALACFALAATFVLIGARIRQGKVEAGLIELVETALLVAVFVCLDPLFAVGLYFMACHSLRHVVKLIQFWSPGDPAAAWWKGVKTVYFKSLPLFVPTALVLGALGTWVVQWQPDKLVVLLLMVFAVVTLPHHLLVDRVLGLEKSGKESA